MKKRSLPRLTPLGSRALISVLALTAAASTHFWQAGRPAGPDVAITSSAVSFRPCDGGEPATFTVYAPRYHGRTTASGAIYDHEGLTCAVPVEELSNGRLRPSIPFGAKLQCQFKDRAVIVTVTDTLFLDRIDLSGAAMRELTGDGLPHKIEGEYILLPEGWQ